MCIVVTIALLSCAGLADCAGEVKHDAAEVLANENVDWISKESSITKLFPSDSTFFSRLPKIPQFNFTTWKNQFNTSNPVDFVFKNQQKGNASIVPKPWQLPNIFPFNIGPKKDNSTWVTPSGKNGSKIFLPVQTVSKFPPVVEFFVQKIQAAQSNYVYEDLSRPPTYDKPVFTLSPEDQIAFGLASTTKSPTINDQQTPKPISNDDFDYEEIANNTEALFEIVKTEENSSAADALKNAFVNCQLIIESLKPSLSPSPTVLNNLTMQVPNVIDKDGYAISQPDVGLPDVVFFRGNDAKNVETISASKAAAGKICSQVVDKPEKDGIHSGHMKKRPAGAQIDSIKSNESSTERTKENSRIANFLGFNRQVPQPNQTNQHGLPNVVYEEGKYPIRSSQGHVENHGTPHVIFLRRIRRNKGKLKNLSSN